MSKETYYFPHDYEPTSDPKIQALLGEYGGIGYGIFWRAVEMLHSEESHKLPLKNYIFLAIAKQMLTSAEQTQAILNFAITTCELFVSDGDFFWSTRVNENFKRREEISEKRAISGRLGVEAKRNLAIAKQNLANTSKEKEKKENKEYTPDFLLFYKTYPKRKAPAEAWKAWKKLNGKRPPIEKIIDAINNQKQTEDWLKNNGQYIPYPATWLNGERWNDEINKENKNWQTF